MGAIVMSYHDITAGKRAEEELRRVTRALKVLTEYTQILAHTTDENELLQHVCRIAVNTGGYRRASVAFAEQDEAKIVRPVAVAGYDEGYLGTLDGTCADTEKDRGPTGTAIRTGKFSIARNVLTDPNLAPWRAEATRHGYASSIALPLLAEERALGALTICASEPDAFDAEEVELLTGLADDVVYGILALRMRAEHKRAEEQVRSLNLDLERRVIERTAQLATGERQLSEARAFLENLVATSPVLIFRVAPASLEVDYLSPNADRLLGYSQVEVMGVPNFVLDHVHPEDRERLLAVIAEAVAAKASQTEQEVRLLHKDGMYRWFNLVGHFEYDKAGIPASMSGYGVDVTERKQTEDTLREQKATLQAIFESSPDSITFTGLDGTVWFASPAIKEVLGYNPEDPQARDTLDNVHPEDRERFAQALQGAAASGEVKEIRHRRLHASGEWVIIESRLRRMTDAEGRPSGVLVVSRNVTEQVQVDEALRLAKVEADRANQAKSEFLSRMSHELRTPLNAILGFAQLLEMDALDAAQRESVNHILYGGRHLLELINEVLDIARIESGRLAISPEPTPVKDVVQESLDLIAPLAVKDEVHLDDQLSDGQDWHIQADRQRLQQILLNLLSNGVKYNRKGGTVAVSCEEIPEGRLRIKVTDTGPGIPSDRLERLFAPFERLGRGQVGAEGTGLGLALSKHLAEAMGGAVGVESTVGLGSTFWVEFPLAEAPVERLVRLEALPAPAERAASSRTRVVLYIEDNLSNLKLIEHLLSRGPKVRLLPAMQGRLGLDLAREHRPELILLDLHLPDMPGDEVLRQLRAAPETRHIPVIIISADATSGQIDRLLAAGARAYLTKPLDIQKLLVLLDETLRARAPGDASRGA